MSAPCPVPRPRLAVLDALRGLAALWVGLFHFTRNGDFNEGFPADMPLKWLGTYGWLGVYVFFVISGFILPWTMARGGYRLRDYGRFLWKRVLRLHPLYLVSVGAMLVPFLFHSAGTMAARTWADWWPHFFYLNDALHRPWLMEIYWTLALEAQYYLAIGLFFPLLQHRHAVVRWTVMAALILLPLWADQFRTVQMFSALFAMGILTCQRLNGRIGPMAHALSLLACGLVTWRVMGWPQALTGLLTAVAIASVPLHHRVLEWLGTVSYPFYLFHSVVAGLLMPWLAMMPRGPWQDTAAVLGLFAISLGLSWGLHRVVERPSMRWSSAVLYRRD
jgi:peptidoglycan/LPS O-acetylase OafA/YrhL